MSLRSLYPGLAAALLLAGGLCPALAKPPDLPLNPEIHCTPETPEPARAGPIIGIGIQISPGTVQPIPTFIYVRPGEACNPPSHNWNAMKVVQRCWEAMKMHFREGSWHHPSGCRTHEGAAEEQEAIETIKAMPAEVEVLDVMPTEVENLECPFTIQLYESLTWDYDWTGEYLDAVPAEVEVLDVMPTELEILLFPLTIRRPWEYDVPAEVEVLDVMPVDISAAKGMKTRQVEVEVLEVLPSVGEVIETMPAELELFNEMPWEHNWIEVRQPEAHQDHRTRMAEQLLNASHDAFVGGNLFAARKMAMLALALDPQAVAAHPLVCKTHLFAQIDAMGNAKSTCPQTGCPAMIGPFSSLPPTDPKVIDALQKVLFESPKSDVTTEPDLYIQIEEANDAEEQEGTEPRPKVNLPPPSELPKVYVEPEPTDLVIPEAEVTEAQIEAFCKKFAAMMRSFQIMSPGFCLELDGRHPGCVRMRLNIHGHHVQCQMRTGSCEASCGICADFDECLQPPVCPKGPCGPCPRR